MGFINICWEFSLGLTAKRESSMAICKDRDPIEKLDFSIIAVVSH